MTNFSEDENLLKKNTGHINPSSHIIEILFNLYMKFWFLAYGKIGKIKKIPNPKSFHLL